MVAERNFVTALGGKNLGIHQTTERPQFLAKLLEAYRTTDVADNTNEKKDDELRNFLMRRNNLILQVHRRELAVLSIQHASCCHRRVKTLPFSGGANCLQNHEYLSTPTSEDSWTTFKPCC
jgi:hypothetical protein